MLGRAMLSGSLIFCAMGATATGPLPEYATGCAKDPWRDAGGIGGKRAGSRPEPAPSHRYPPIIDGRRPHRYAIPSGACITGVVIVPTRGCGESINVRLVDGRREFPITVAPGQSFVLPFAKGWHSDGCAYLVGDGCRAADDFVAWGITDDGPISFACVD